MTVSYCRENMKFSADKNRNKLKALDFLLVSLLGISVSSLFSYEIFKTLSVMPTVKSIIFFCSLFYLFLMISFSGKKIALVISSAVMLGLTGTVAAYFLSSVFASKASSYISGIFAWLTRAQYGYGTEPLTHGKYLVVYTAVIVFMATTVSFLLLRSRVGTILLALTAASFSVIPPLIGVYSSPKAFALLICILPVFYIRASYMSFFSAQQKKLGETEDVEELDERLKTPFSITAAAVLLVALAVAAAFFFTPSDAKIRGRDEALDFTVSELTKLKNSIIRRVNGASFSTFSFSGSGSNDGTSTLAGSITTDRTLVMTVEADAPFYLFGATYNVFDGQTWSKASSPDVVSRINSKKDIDRFALLVTYSDTGYHRSVMQMLADNFISASNRFSSVLFTDPYGENLFGRLSAASVGKVSSELVSDIYTCRRLRIKYIRPGSNTVFLPDRCFLTESVEDYIIDGEVQNYFGYDDIKRLGIRDYAFSDFPSAGDIYNASYFDLDTSDTKVEQFLRTYSENPDTVINKAISEVNSILQYYGGEFVTGEKLLETMSDYLHDADEDNSFAESEYLSLPDGVFSERLYSLVGELTAGKNPYEKAEAIRDYLRSNYTYSLEVDYPENGENPLEYFLFTGKKGYCTYFATAMTVMCRMAGVPAVYVEGYVSDDTRINGVFAVRSDNAHAWSEIYIKGLGFVRMEATTGYSGGSFSPEPPETPDNTANDTPNEIPDDPVVDNTEPPSDNPSDNTDTQTPSASSGENTIGGGKISEDPLEFFKNRVALTVLICLAAVIVLFTAISHFLLALKFRKLAKSDDSAYAMNGIAAYMERCFTCYGLRRRRCQTLREYARTADAKYTFGDVTYSDVVRIYYKLLYADRKPTEQELAEVRRCLGALRGSHIRNLGFARYFALHVVRAYI